jgi:TolB protein
VRGAFSTRIAYVTKAGANIDWKWLMLTAKVSAALRSNEPIISPSWSADGTKVAYVSFEAKKPVVWVQNLMTGERR